MEISQCDQGSDEYTYDMTQFLAYVLRPTYPHRDRFRQAGENFMRRYGPGPGDREEFVSRIDIARQVMQHVELLADCAAIKAPFGKADCECPGSSNGPQLSNLK